MGTGDDKRATLTRVSHTSHYLSHRARTTVRSLCLHGTRLALNAPVLAAVLVCGFRTINHVLSNHDHLVSPQGPITHARKFDPTLGTDRHGDFVKAPSTVAGTTARIEEKEMKKRVSFLKFLSILTYH